ncbi:hypothetical protein [Pseudoxanthomonas dokdonensis]|uniref:Teneurin-like YD-shell domain-containing protein n=1 Tax=Pseudoxanthomonas dokdonensis TaxID=344882 RepID=A0A0R0CND9_9GAMM|nr:hypothetical protein [Pseudoxanthomonas dokdonensis]KRG71056.1 hypothetical protein ABB29_04345 [Pseudoxanthomonas dokdonensis]
MDLDYRYDKVGNVNVSFIVDFGDGRQTRSMRYDKLNRLTQTTSSMFGAASYGYDKLDNLLSMQVGGGSKKRNYGYYYDSRNRLVNITDHGTGATVIGLEYDAQGNLANSQRSPGKLA